MLRYVIILFDRALPNQYMYSDGNSEGAVVYPCITENWVVYGATIWVYTS